MPKGRKMAADRNVGLRPVTASDGRDPKSLSRRRLKRNADTNHAIIPGRVIGKGGAIKFQHVAVEYRDVETMISECACEISNSQIFARKIERVVWVLEERRYQQYAHELVTLRGDCIVTLRGDCIAHSAFSEAALSNQGSIRRADVFRTLLGLAASASQIWVDTYPAPAHPPCPSFSSDIAHNSLYSSATDAVSRLWSEVDAEVSRNVRKTSGMLGVPCREWADFGMKAPQIFSNEP